MFKPPKAARSGSDSNCLHQSPLQLQTAGGFSVRILSFPNICTNRGSASADLIGNNGFPLFFQLLDEIDY